MSRDRIVIGNWKMNPGSRDEAVALARSVAALPVAAGVAVAVAPPAVFLPAVAEVLTTLPVGVYAQDVHWEEKGAFTGQLAASMLAPFVLGAIVGHSEVRRDQGDDDERVAKKMLRALGHGMWTVVCVGESLEEYLAGRSASVVTGQTAIVVRALHEFGSRSAIRRLDEAGEDGAMSDRIVFAYEPIWAIGTGRAATGTHATICAQAIRDQIAMEDGPGGDRVRVLYGGSVTAANAAEFAGATGIDGALVGGASLKAAEFGAIIAAFAG